MGGQTVGPERNPDREIIFATLSTAMVGPMDGIGLLNKTRTMASCNAAGFVLKPDRPISTADYCFVQTCQVATTYSDVSGLGKVYYIFNNDGGSIEPGMIPSSSTPYAVLNWYDPAAGVAKLAPGMTIAPGYEGHGYAVAAPVMNGWVFVGETSKYVSASTVRFSSVAASGSGITAQVIGVAGETVNVCAASAASMGKLVCVSVKFTAAGTQPVSFPPASA